MLAALAAPAHWRSIDFISDLHLQAQSPVTVGAWSEYLSRTQADALFILGDLFEVWVGDDALNAAPSQGAQDAEPRVAPCPAEPNFESSCAARLHELSNRLALFVMQGNRDFLIGQGFADQSGARLIADPFVLSRNSQRWLLSHGDALCLEDADYMQFRAQVRSAAWQQDFLAKPLEQRLALARGLRRESELRKQVSHAWVDLDEACTLDWLRAADAQTMIHGHTHRPADHPLPEGRRRLVLSDWDFDQAPARGEVLRLHLPIDAADGAQARIERIPVVGLH